LVFINDAESGNSSYLKALEKIAEMVTTEKAYFNKDFETLFTDLASMFGGVKSQPTMLLR
jgi:hypothetical protein